jgi:hypothetical protein
MLPDCGDVKFKTRWASPWLRLVFTDTAKGAVSRREICSLPLGITTSVHPADSAAVEMLLDEPRGRPPGAPVPDELWALAGTLPGRLRS